MKKHWHDEKLVEEWQKVPVGTKVILTRDDGSELVTRTRSEPWLLGHGQGVIKVEGVSGGYSLDRIRLHVE